MNNNYINETSLLVSGACGIYKRLNVALHTHEQIELVFIASGTLDMTINDQQFHLVEGDFIAVNSYDLHSLTSATKGNSYICPILPSRLSSALVNLSIYGKIHHDHDKSLYNILSAYQLYTAPYDSYRDIYYAGLAELLRILHNRSLANNIELRRDITSNIKGYELRNATARSAELRIDIISYINENYRHDLHLCDIMRHCNTNASYASVIIREATSLTLPSYLNRLRLSAFVEECKMDRDISINALLSDVGFSSPRTFYRAFRKEFHMTPQEFIALLKLNF